MSKLIIDIDEELHFKFKQCAINKKTSMRGIILKYVEGYVNANKKVTNKCN